MVRLNVIVIRKVHIVRWQEAMCWCWGGGEQYVQESQKSDLLLIAVQWNITKKDWVWCHIWGKVGRVSERIIDLYEDSEKKYGQ